MKTIHNFIYEKLKLNKQSQLLKRKRSENDLDERKWEDKIKDEFNLNDHRLAYSYINNNIYKCIHSKHGDWKKLRFAHLDKIPEYCKNICEDIIDCKEVKEATILYENSPYYNEVNIYHIYYNSMHIILIIRFKESPAIEKYDAYEVYEID